MNTARQIDWVEDEHPPFAKGSDTSREAAESLTNTARLRDKVLRVIRSRGSLGITDQELQAILQLPPNVETPRRWELVNAGLVRDSGLRRMTPSRRRAAVWVAVPEVRA